MNAFKLVFLAKACFKVVVRGGEAIVFFVDPYYQVLLNDKRKYHGAVDKSSLEQQLRKSDMITVIV